MVEVTALVRSNYDGTRLLDKLLPSGMVEHVNVELGSDEGVAGRRGSDSPALAIASSARRFRHEARLMRDGGEARRGTELGHDICLLHAPRQSAVGASETGNMMCITEGLAGIAVPIGIKVGGGPRPAIERLEDPFASLVGHGGEHGAPYVGDEEVHGCSSYLDVNAYDENDVG